MMAIGGSAMATGVSGWPAGHRQVCGSRRRNSWSAPRPLITAAAPDVIKGRGADQLFRRLKPHTCLCPAGHPNTPVAIAEPPIAIILADKLWDPVLERRLGSARPQVRWLKHVIVR